MENDFDLTVEYLRDRRSSKWSRYPGTVIPAWIAEMDFAIAPEVQQAIDAITSRQDYGYPRRLTAPAENDVGHAFVRRMKRLYDWDIDGDCIQPVTDLIQATMAAVLAFTDPGDGVIIQTPCYPPFRQAVIDSGRRVIDNPLNDNGTTFVMDLEGLSASVDSRTTLWILCNPHNPTGRVFTKTELLTMAEFALERGMLLFSDEIHSDLVYEGSKHIPISSLSSDVAAITVTANSPTKSFNLPGLRCGVMHFGTPELRASFHKALPKIILGKPSVVGIDATIAAWDNSDAWLQSVHAHLTRARDFTVKTIRETMPGLKLYVPESTYLAWIDCGEGKGPAADFFLEKAGLAFSPGETFSADKSRHIRLNFATSIPILTEIFDRMGTALAGSRALERA